MLEPGQANTSSALLETPKQQTVSMSLLIWIYSNSNVALCITYTFGKSLANLIKDVVFGPWCRFPCKAKDVEQQCSLCPRIKAIISVVMSVSPHKKSIASIGYPPSSWPALNTVLAPCFGGCVSLAMSGTWKPFHAHSLHGEWMWFVKESLHALQIVDGNLHVSRQMG